jgi:hypothetical protein
MVREVRVSACLVVSTVAAPWMITDLQSTHMHTEGGAVRRRGGTYTLGQRVAIDV